ncbi:MAG: DNA-binding protein [Roseburia inulinivorans]
MIVVSDTTPLISLLKVGHLDLLDKYFGEVQIPQAVFDELTSNKRFALEAEEIRNCPYIRVVQIEDDKSVDIIRRVTGLDLGESEAIILTDNLHSDSKEAECSVFTHRKRTNARIKGLSEKVNSARKLKFHTED